MPRLSRTTRRAIAPYLLALPAAVLLFVFFYGVVNGVLQGFGIMPFLGRTEFTLDYYIEALTRSDLSSSIAYSLYQSAVSAVLAIIGGVALSAVMTRAKTSRLQQLVKASIGVSVAVDVVEPDAVERSLGKMRRIVDRRPKR